VHGHRCLACGKHERTLRKIGRVLAPDHVVPLRWRGSELRGSRGLISNVQPLCHGLGGCNNVKGCTIVDYRPRIQPGPSKPTLAVSAS
jgi:hypothetical protein